MALPTTPITITPTGNKGLLRGYSPLVWDENRTNTPTNEENVPEFFLYLCGGFNMFQAFIEVDPDIGEDEPMLD